MANTKVSSEQIIDDVALAGNPTTTTQSAGNNTTRVATTAFVTTAVSDLVDSAPSSLNTLNELAAAMNDNASFFSTVLPLSGGTMTGNISHAGDLTLDVGGDIILDADGGDVILKDGGTNFAILSKASANLDIYNAGNDGSVVFKGEDGGTGITALTLDMSDAGTATFNSHILLGNTVTNPVSNFADQTGIALKNSATVPELQVSSDSTAMQLGRTSTGGAGQILALRQASNTIASLGSNGFIFNENSDDIDFRIESNGSTHMFHVDAGNNKILMSSNPADDTQSTPHDTLTLALAYASSGANGVAGLGPRLAFKIPDDEDNPSLGGGIAVVKESADDSDSSAAMTFAISQNDETLDEAMRITSDGFVMVASNSTVPTNMAGLQVQSGGLLINGTENATDFHTAAFQSNYWTYFGTSGKSGGYSGSFRITVPNCNNGASNIGYGSFQVEVYLSGYNGAFCHAMLSGYQNSGINIGEAVVIRSGGSHSVTYGSEGAQGFYFDIDIPSYTHPSAFYRITKAGDNSSDHETDMKDLTVAWS